MVILLTFPYKLNCVCNASLFSFKNAIPNRNTHKNQLQGEFSTIYSISQVLYSIYCNIMPLTYEGKKSHDLMTSALFSYKFITMIDNRLYVLLFRPSLSQFFPYLTNYIGNSRTTVFSCLLPNSLINLLFGKYPA